MDRYLNIQTLTTYCGVLLVRDANGQAKEMPYGDAVRTTITPQCLRRAQRTYLREQANAGKGPLAGYAFGTRTREWARLITTELTGRGWEAAPAAAMAKEALTGLGINFGTKDASADLTKVLIFAHDNAARDSATALDEHRAELEPWLADVTAARTRNADVKKKTKSKKHTTKETDTEPAPQAEEEAKAPPLPAKVRKALLAAFSPADALDIALYGRFLAEIADAANIDGAIQTLSSVSVAPSAVVDDFYSSADDAKLHRRAHALDVFDAPGAGMTGYQSLVSGTFFGHNALDRVKLRRTLTATTRPLKWDADRIEAAAQAAEAAFIDAVCHAVPDAKRNTTAAPGTLPKLVLTFTSNRPHNYVSAFESAIDETQGAASLQATRRLLAHHNMIIRKCGIDAGRVMTYDLAITDLLAELRTQGQLPAAEADTPGDLITGPRAPEPAV
ncbi:type I-E CRISPR-associated protein Cas7/Cse4/CasC [Streptomyces chrestomyceticus]|uniref:type I-E CRISPR-associated protein Cas7/Cse4/CasC n=1 Tax=Streptomyces chrestomyceticus TaxID=68185 RepID=UPI003797540D